MKTSPLPSLKNIVAAVTLSFAACQLAAQEFDNTITINSRIVIDTIDPIWNGIGGASGLALTPQGERLLKRISESSPYPFYKRVWGITSTGTAVPFTAEADWGSANVYQVDENGDAFYDFTLFDQILDATLKHGFIPIMHLGLMPDSLSAVPDSIPRTGDNPVKYPPKDFDRWYDLVFNIIKHCLDRYGKEEVIKWKWEMWNEPDISNYWMGSEEEFFKMYDYTAAAVKAALPGGQVGGNSVTQDINRGTPKLIRFIQHCMQGKNYRDGSTGAPLDFITFHLKGTDFAISKIGNFTSNKLGKDIRRFSPGVSFIKQSAVTNLTEIARIPGTAGIPVYVTEGDIDIGLNVTTTENPGVEYRNTAYHAVFQCAFVKEMLDLAITFPDNPIKCLVFDGLFNPGYRLFEGQRTLFTAEELAKPVFNTYQLLGKLGVERIQLQRSAINFVDGIATRRKNNVQVMIYNYNENVEDKESRKVRLSVKLPSTGSYKVSHYRIDENHSNAYTIWKRMGSPFNPDEKQLKRLKEKQGLELMEPGKVIATKDGAITTSLTLPHHSVSLLLFEKVQ